MDIAAWLQDLGLERYVQTFRDHEIDAEVMRELTDGDLEKLGIPLGHRKKLLKAIRELSEPDPESGAARSATPTPRAPEAERRQLSVLFCDLVGSTELAARLDPEDMGTVIRAYHGVCAEVVERWGGHVAKYMGDGVLAYFGWPQAHEDDAERAVRAGLELAERVTKLDAGGTALSARVGIATGLVMVGELTGEGAAKEQTVVGETPNLAARLQGLAAPGAVVISQTTRRLIGGLFELADLGPQRIKGFAEPLVAWRVEGEGGAEGRFEALRGQRLTPLIGREHELGILLERWAWAKQGDGQVVLLSGEPGIGKSRLLWALREALSGEPHVPLSHFCSPHHTNSALYPIISQLERAAGFAPQDGPEVRLVKLETLLGRASDQLDEAVPLLAALLGIPAGDRYPALSLTPQRQKQRTLETLIDQLESLARERPVLELYEDVHWIDPSTLELLDLLIERVRALPVLAVLTFRPEFTPPWTGRSHVTVLPLNRLGRRQGVAIVARITGGKVLPAEVLEQIVAKTDGVPLFVEELTKTVLESGLLHDAGDHFELSGPLPPLAIPATLHDSLMARLDHLAPVKEVAQIGAVIGREFSHELLAAVSPLPEDRLGDALDQLVDSELVFRRGTPPAATYTFKHALVQDAAYQSLLKSKRRQLHARVAEVLERWFADSAEHQPELLAHHLTEAGLDERAAERWQTAGEKAAARSAYREALAQLQQGLEVVTRAADEPWCARREIGLQNAIGVVLPTVRGFVPEVKQAYERARELARSVNDRESLFKATYGLWLISTRKARFETAAQLSDELLAAVEQELDEGLALQAHHAAWTTGWQRGEPETARRHAEIGVRLYRADQHHRLASVYGGHDAGVCCRYTAALANWLLGYPDGAVGRGRESLALAREVRHPYSLTLAFTYVALLHEFRREPDVVVGHVEAMTDLSSEQGFPLRATAGRLHEAWLLLMHGEIDAAARQIADALAREEALGSRMMHPYFLGWLVEAYLRAGRPEDGLATVERAFDVVREGQVRWWEAELHRLHGELYLARRTAGDRADPEACFRRALTVARDQHARSLELRAATSLAKLLAERGDRRGARDLLAPVYGWFTEGFDTADLKDGKALLDELN